MYSTCTVCRGRMRRAVVEEYLHEAYRLGFRALRIVHGRGIGVQREISVRPGAYQLRFRVATTPPRRREAGALRW